MSREDVWKRAEFLTASTQSPSTVLFCPLKRGDWKRSTQGATLDAMSPRRIEHSHLLPDGSIFTWTREHPNGFPVGPTDAEKIVGISRTTLLRHSDDIGVPLQRGGRGPLGKERMYSDAHLIKLASRTRHAALYCDAESGLAQLETEETITLLDIPFQEALEIYVRD